jgi:hypothetical protein
MFQSGSIVKHNDFSDGDEKLLLCFVMGQLISFLETIKDTKYYGEFEVAFRNEPMSGDYISIVYKADTDVSVCMGLDVDFTIVAMVSTYEGIMGNYGRTLNGEKGFTIETLVNFINTTLNDLFVKGMIDEILVNEKRAEICKGYSISDINNINTVEIGMSNRRKNLNKAQKDIIDNF